MSNGLIPLDMSQLPSTSVGADQDFADLSKGADFLGRLQLSSKGKTDDDGKVLVQPGHYFIPLSGGEVINLGDTVEILAVSRRTKAIDMSDKPVITVYDASTDEFKRIWAKSEVKDSGCQVGPSFLLYERKTGRPLEYFLGAPTHRPEAQKMFPNLPLTQTDIDKYIADGVDMEGRVPGVAVPMTLTSKFIKKEKFSWWVPVVKPSSSPFTKLPANDVILKEIKKFREATSEVETAPVAEETTQKTGRKR